MLHPLPLPLSSCLGCIPPLIGLPSLRFYAVGSSLFLLSVCFCLCSLFYRDDVLCWLLLARPFLYAFHAHLRFPVDLVWFRLSCDHGWIRSGSVNVRKQQTTTTTTAAASRDCLLLHTAGGSLKLIPGIIGPLIQTAHEATPVPARFWDRAARWLVVQLYVLEQPGDELQRFFGEYSPPL